MLVEDDPLIASLFADVLSSLGYEVLWAASVAAAVEILAARVVDVAVLDVQLGPDYSYPVADLLHQAGTPFMFVSAVPKGSVPSEHQARPFLSKPYRITEVHRSLCAMLG